MFKQDDLKSIIMLSELNEAMLKKIYKVTIKTNYSSGEYIFREGEYAEYLYSVFEGKVGLELERNAGGAILIDTITRGYAFGFSSLVDMEQKKYASHAIALTDITLFKWSYPDLERLFYEDYEMGFLLMRKIAKIAKKRLQIRNVQFLDIYR